MKLSRQEVQHIALLARLGLTESETEKFQFQISNILENMEILQEVNTDDVPATAQSIALQNVFRPDEAETSSPVEDILTNAPKRDGDSFRVPTVLE